MLDYITSRHLIIQEGRTQNITADPAEVDEFVENIRTQTCTQVPMATPEAANDPEQVLESCANFFGFQGASGMRRYLQEEIVINKVIETVAKGEEVHAAHVLVNTEEEAKAVRERVTTGGEDFTPLLRKSRSSLLLRKAVVIWVSLVLGRWSRSSKQAAFALKDGEISEPVQTQFGWHIIKVIERRPSETVSPQAANAYREQLIAQAKAGWACRVSSSRQPRPRLSYHLQWNCQPADIAPDRECRARSVRRRLCRR